MVVAIIAVEFPEAGERAKAMSAYTFVVAGGASLGLLLGGVLTQAINWHWIFFVNLPIGAAAFFFGRRLIVENEGLGVSKGIDWLGSVLITGASIIGIYALIKIPEWGWTGGRTLGAGRSLARPAGRLRRLRVPHLEPDHALAHPRASAASSPRTWFAASW